MQNPLVMNLNPETLDEGTSRINGLLMSTASFEVDIANAEGDIKARLPVCPTMTVRDLKLLLQLAQMVQGDDHTVRFDGTSALEPMDTKTLAEYSLTEGSQVTISKNLEIQLLVLALTGERYNLKVYPTTSVLAVKELISEQIGVSVGNFYVTVAGKPLEDPRLLADYNITENCTMFVILRLRGGMYHRSTGRQGNQPYAAPPLAELEINMLDGSTTRKLILTSQHTVQAVLDILAADLGVDEKREAAKRKRAEALAMLAEADAELANIQRDSDSGEVSNKRARAASEEDGKETKATPRRSARVTRRS